MVIVQAIFSLLSKLTGKVLNAIFGWAVVALFGRSSPRQQTLLTGLVGAAAAWPLLLLGIAAPKIAALVIAFVPYSKHIPALVLRLIWITLAVAVPIAVGLVVASKAPPGSPRESFAKRVARGFPITVGNCRRLPFDVRGRAGAAAGVDGARAAGRARADADDRRRLRARSRR